MIFIGTGLPLGGSGQIGLGIYRSQDGGETWQQVNTGLIDTTITDLAVYPNGTLLAATYRGGVHRSTDGGDTWLPLNRGLPSLQVTALAVTDEGTVYAGTDQGIYRSTRPIATDTKDEPALPERFHLGANYPNPFNPQTTITYALPRGTEVHLAVYDVLGREVAVLVDGTRPAGRHAAVFEAGNLPSGMYLVRLNAGEHFETRSMTLMK
ncbi:MAG: T9SS type A sorting domain-containing protein [Bacteroidetes bacterium]|nr:T9SS type A sorting domain-containing protein [Bacteroidota bacterium]